MGSMPSIRLMAVLALAVCAQPSRTSPPPTDRQHKPSAPITLTIKEQPAGKGETLVTLVATPTRNVDKLDLWMDGRASAQFGPTPAGVERELVARIQQDRALVFGSARTTVGASVRTASVAELVGSDEPVLFAAPPTRTIVLPNGARVAETRP